MLAGRVDLNTSGGSKTALWYWIWNQDIPHDTWFL